MIDPLEVHVIRCILPDIQIRPLAPLCPVGIESDTIRVRHETDSTFGRILNPDTNFQRNGHKLPSCPENRTRTRKTGHVTGGKRQQGSLKFNFLSFYLSFERKQLIESEFYVQVKEF